MAKRDLAADLASYATKVKSGEYGQTPTTKYNTTTKQGGAPGQNVTAKTGGKKKKKDWNPLLDEAPQQEEQQEQSQQQKQATFHAEEAKQGKSTKFSDEANAKKPGPAKHTTTSKTSEEYTDPFAKWEAELAAKETHKQNYQSLLDEAERLQREGQTRSQIWQDGIYIGEDKQAADEYAKKIADVQARAQAELDAAGGEHGFHGLTGAAKSVGANLESGIWGGVMGLGQAGASKVGQGISAEDSSSAFGKSAAANQAKINRDYVTQLKDIWNGGGSIGNKVKSTAFSTFNFGTQTMDKGAGRNEGAYLANNALFYILRNWTLPKITGSDDAKTNADWLTGKAYEATDKLTGKVSQWGPMQYVDNENLESAMAGSDAASQIAGQVANVVGRMLPSIAVSWATKDPDVGLSVMAASAAGSAADEAYKRGATPEQAYYIGLEKGYVEFLTERMFSGIGLLGNGVLSEGAKRLLGDFALTKLGRALAKITDVGGENVEEAVSDWAASGIDKAVLGYLPEGEDDITLWQAMLGQMPWTEQGLITLLSTFVMGGVSDIAQNGLRRADADAVMEVVNIARNSGNERLAALADEYAALIEKRGSMGAKDFSEFAEATMKRIGEEEFTRQLQEQQQQSTGASTMTMFSDPATGLNADQLALAKTPDSAAVDGMKTNAASWLTAAITGTETGESILGEYISPDVINQLPEGAQKVALAFANTQFAEEAAQNVMNYAAEIVNGNPVEWDDAHSNAAAGYALGTLSNLFHAGEQVDQKRQQAIAAEAVEFALSGMTIDEAIAVANQSAQKTLTATPLTVQNAPESVQAQEGVNTQQNEENAAEGGYNQPESQGTKANTENPEKIVKQKKGSLNFNGGTLQGVDVKGVDMDNLNRQQKKAVAAAQVIADALPINFVFFDEAPQGKNVRFGALSGDTMYINLSAAIKDKDGTMKFIAGATMSHELTHYLQKNDPDSYAELKDFVTSTILKKSPAALNRLVKQQMKMSPGMTEDEAMDEIVANACQTMLYNSRAITKLARENMTLAEKIVDFFDSISDKLQAAFDEVDINDHDLFRATRLVADEIDELQKRWDRGIERAAKNATGEDVDGATQYSLVSVDPVEPSTGDWGRTHTTEEAMEAYPDLWNVTAEESEKRNPTQVSSTQSTYRRIYKILQNRGFKGRILDASSGLGVGTELGRSEFGFDVDDIEPYPGEDYNPKYKDYSKLNEKYDAIISSAVLNVLPQDQRDALVVKMGELLNPGGVMYITTRGKDVDSLGKTGKNIHLGPMEWIETARGSYQKGFTQAELKAYLKDALGDGFLVEDATTKNGGKFNNNTNIVVTKFERPPQTKGIALGSEGVRGDVETLTKAKGDDGKPLFQIAAFENDEQEYRDMLTKWGGMTDEEIDTLFDTVDAALDIIKPNREILDYAWDADIDDRAFLPIKQNSDKLYKVSNDYSTLCRKRILQGVVADQLQAALGRVLTRDEGIAVRDALKQLQSEGLEIEVACALCYVESARMKSPEQIQRFLNDPEKVLRNYFASKDKAETKQIVDKAEQDERAAVAREYEGGAVNGFDIKTTPLKYLPGKIADRIRDAKKGAMKDYQPTEEQQRAIDTAKKMTVTDFTSAKGLENLAKHYPLIYDAYTTYIRNATSSKGIENDTWWRAGDSQMVGDSTIDQMNAENGLRTQSWSDMQVKHLIDYIAGTIELATREAKQHAYTKVYDYVDLMGETNEMINMSLIPTADYKGELDFDPVEGFPIEDAIDMRDKFPETAGTICIGINNDQIRQLLDSPVIDYVIPYHHSGMSKSTRAAMHIPGWDSYQGVQNERAMKRKAAEENVSHINIELLKKQQKEDALDGQAARENADRFGVQLLDESDKKWHKGPKFSEWFDLKKAQATADRVNKELAKSGQEGKYGVMTGGYIAMQEAAEEYKRICAERGLQPKFSYGSGNFVDEPNYWKLLIDRKMVNNDKGNIIEQKPLKPKFNKETVMRILNDELKRYPKVKHDQDEAIRRVTEAFLDGKLKIGMNAEDLAAAMKKPMDNLVQMQQYAEEDIADEDGPGWEENAIYIKDGHRKKDGSTVDFINLILDGKKKGETRTHKSLARGWLGISKDGKVYGRVKLGEPIPITKDSPEYKEAMIEGTDYDIEEGGTKYYYPILETEDFRDNPRPILRHGNYGRYNRSAQLQKWEEGGDVVDILNNPTGENGQLSNKQVDSIVENPEAFEQFLQATGLQETDIDRSTKSNTRKSVKDAAVQYLADQATARRADELGRQADEWNKAHENDVREEEFQGVDEKNWNRFWKAAHNGYEGLVNLIAKDAKNMADYMRIFKDATGEEMSSDPDVLKKQLQDLARDATADSITGNPLVSPQAVSRTETGSNLIESQPTQTNKKLNWNAPGKSAPKTSQVYANTYTKTGEAVDLNETDFQYVPITERESIRRAASKVANNPDQVLKDLYGSRIWLSEQVDAAYIIKGYLRSKALATDSEADWKAYRTFAKVVQERGTEAGRGLQAFAKQSRPNAGSLLDTIEAEVDRMRRDAASRTSRWKVSAEQIAEVEKKGQALAKKLAKLENRYDEYVENGMNKSRAWEKVKGDYVKMASEIAAERMVGLASDVAKNAKLRNEIQRGVHDTTTLLEKMLAGMDEDYIRRYVAISAAGITEDVKYKGKLTAEKVSRYVNTLHKQGMLASAPTTLRNLEGNTVFGTVDWAANNTAGAAMDALFGMFTGERTRGMEWGVLDPRVVKAAKTEMIKSVLEIAANIDLYDTPRDAKYGTSGQYSVNPYGNIGSRILMRAEQGLKYALESTDAFFVGAAEASAGMAASRANARRGGSMTEKTAEAIGKNEAHYRTFKNVTPVQEFLQGLRGFIDRIGFGGEITNWGGTKVPIRKGGFGLGTLTVPFIGVPVNIALKSAEYSPFNILLGIRTAKKMADAYAEAKKTGDKELYQKALMLQNQAAGQMGRGAFGSVLVALLMAAMKRAKKKDLEIYKDWNLEENADVKAQNKAEGKFGQQVNVSMLMRHLLYGKDKDPGGWEKGDLAVNVSANEPMDQFLTMASILADDDDAPDILDFGEAAGKGTLDSIMDLSCIASITEFMNTMNYNPVYKTEEKLVNGETVEEEVIDERATRVNATAAMLAKSLSGFVPAAVRHAAAATDTYQRDTKGDTAVDTAWNQILSNIPGKYGRESLPVKTDNFGVPIKTGDRNTRLANTYLANSYSRVNQSDVSAELERLREETGDVLLPPRNAPKTITYGSGKDQIVRRLTADQGRDYHETNGLDYKRQLQQLFSTREYQYADTDTQEAMVKALKQFSNDTARTDFAFDHGIRYDSKYADARKLDDPTMSVSLRAGYNDAMKDGDWSTVDDMTRAAGSLSEGDREYLGKSDYFGFMYDMAQKGTSSSKVHWYQVDLKDRIAPSGKTQPNGYEIFQTVVDGVKKNMLTEEDADNFMNRQKSDGSYYVAKGRHSVYEGLRNSGYSPEDALEIWEKIDTDKQVGTLNKKEFDDALKKYQFDDEAAFKDSVYKANGWGKYKKKKKK